LAVKEKTVRLAAHIFCLGFLYHTYLEASPCIKGTSWPFAFKSTISNVINQGLLQWKDLTVLVSWLRLFCNSIFHALINLYTLILSIVFVVVLVFSVSHVLTWGCKGEKTSVGV